MSSSPCKFTHFCLEKQRTLLYECELSSRGSRFIHGLAVPNSANSSKEEKKPLGNFSSLLLTGPFCSQLVHFTRLLPKQKHCLQNGYSAVECSRVDRSIGYDQRFYPFEPFFVFFSLSLMTDALSVGLHIQLFSLSIYASERDQLHRKNNKQDGGGTCTRFRFAFRLLYMHLRALSK